MFRVHYAPKFQNQRFFVEEEEETRDAEINSPIQFPRILPISTQSHRVHLRHYVAEYPVTRFQRCMYPRKQFVSNSTELQHLICRVFFS